MILSWPTHVFAFDADKQLAGALAESVTSGSSSNAAPQSHAATFAAAVVWHVP